MSVSGFMGYLKGKSSLMPYEQFGDLKFKYRNREFWCRGYYVDTVGKNTAKIQDYIKHQLEEDKMGEQLSIPYPGSPHCRKTWQLQFTYTASQPGTHQKIIDMAMNGVGCRATARIMGVGLNTIFRHLKNSGRSR